MARRTKSTRFSTVAAEVEKAAQQVGAILDGTTSDLERRYRATRIALRHASALAAMARRDDAPRVADFVLSEAALAFACFRFLTTRESEASLLGKGVRIIKSAAGPWRDLETIEPGIVFGPCCGHSAIDVARNFAIEVHSLASQERPYVLTGGSIVDWSVGRDIMHPTADQRLVDWTSLRLASIAEFIDAWSPAQIQRDTASLLIKMEWECNRTAKSVERANGNDSVERMRERIASVPNGKTAKPDSLTIGFIGRQAGRKALRALEALGEYEGFRS